MKRPLVGPAILFFVQPDQIGRFDAQYRRQFANDLQSGPTHTLFQLGKVSPIDVGVVGEIARILHPGPACADTTGEMKH